MIKKKEPIDSGKALEQGPRKIFVLAKDREPVHINELIRNQDMADVDINRLIQFGVINLNKPMGPTSHQVSAWVKTMFGLDKVGHGGTLDPRVTGVLPLAFYSSAKMLNVLTYSSKEYICVMRLHGDVPLKQVKNVCNEFIGPIYQYPPLRSAVKRQLRIRTIYSLDIIEQNARDILLKIKCASGTYIRVLVHDLGQVLGCGAHMQELRRTRTGPFHEKNSVTLHQLKDAFIFWKEDGEEKYLRDSINPMESLLLDLPKMIIHDSAIDAVCHGADLAVPGVIQFDEILRFGEPMAMFSQKGEGVAIGETKMITKDLLKAKSGVVLKTNRVIMEPGTYEKGWKSKELRMN